jgi:hypothetical protein
VDQPGEVLGRAVAGVRRQPLGPEAEPLARSVQHPPLRGHLGLAHRGRRLDVHDHRVVEVDQIVGAVGEEGESAIGAGPARRRVGRRDELGHDLRRGTERGIVQHLQILADRMVARIRGQPVRTRLGGSGRGSQDRSNQPPCPSVPPSRPVGRRGERGAAARDPTGAVAALEIARLARDAAAARFPNMSGANDARDAYRHFYWSFGMTRILGPDRALAFGNAHEAQYPDNPRMEERMDTWNNAVGRAMALDSRYRGMPTADVAEIAMENRCLRILPSGG